MNAWLTIVGVAVAGVVVATKALIEASRRGRLRRRMKAGARQIADRALVTLEGTVHVLERPLTAPLSGLACVAHKSRARTRNSVAAASPHVIAVLPSGALEKIEMVPFMLATRDGKVLVGEAPLELPIRPRPIIPRRIERELAFLGESTGVLHPNELSFEEIVIEPGQRIRVHGIAIVDIAPDSGAGGEVGYRDTRQVVRLVGDEQHPLMIAEA